MQLKLAHLFYPDKQITFCLVSHDMKRTGKLWIAGAVILAGLFLGRFAFAIINDPISAFLIIVAALLFLAGIIYFAINFRE